MARKSVRRKAPKRAKRATAAKKKSVAAPERGRFVWYELLTTDPDAAQRFYPPITGWGMQPFDQNPSYTMWTHAGNPVGGVMALPEEAKRMGAPPNWMAYVATPDVDATARQAAALGGKLLNGPMDIPSVGRFVVLRDPQGAVVAAFRPSQWSPGAMHKPQLGEFSWHELVTSDYQAAFQFYRTLFGWETTKVEDMGPQGIYQMFGLGGHTLGGMRNKRPNDPPGPPSWTYYVRVESADRAANQVQAAGGKLLAGPLDVPGGDRIAVCQDPQGAVFAVHWRNA